ncbi:MAG: winged helix-turn-helix transcriptional regulator [Hyphomicrobiales bacterium]
MSRAAEIVAERWTPLVLRELLCGSKRFNEVRRGVPRMSPSLLSRRLKELEHAGIIERHEAADGRGAEYSVTAAGRELQPVITAMGNWAQRWVRSDLVADENLDPVMLMWDVRRRADLRPLKDRGRFVVRFHLEGAPADRRRFWLIFEDGEADLCLRDHDFDIDLYVNSSVLALTEIWLGHIEIDQAVRDRRLAFDGAAGDIKAFKSWFSLSHFAEVGREAVAAGIG